MERKKSQLEFLQHQLHSLKAEQETVVSIDTQLPADFEKSVGQRSMGEFSPFLLLDRFNKLEELLADMQTRIESEDVTSEQMSALLLKTKDSTLRSKGKMDQLRYLQKRLFKRHDEIITMQARAANEFIHANHDATKAVEETHAVKVKAEEKMREKRDAADTLKQEVEQLAETTARRLLNQHVPATQDSQIKVRRTAAELERITSLHSQQKLVTAAHQETVLRSKAAIESIRKYG